MYNNLKLNYNKKIRNKIRIKVILKWLIGFVRHAAAESASVLCCGVHHREDPESVLVLSVIK